MFKKIKIGFQLVKYGLSFKMQVAFALIFLLVGILIEAVGHMQTFLGGFYIVLSALFIYQLIISLDISTLVQSSPYKKRLQTSLPILASTIAMLVAFTIVVLFKWYAITFNSVSAADPAWVRMQIQELLLVAALVFFVQIYSAPCYKKFVLSVILMVIIMVPTVLCGETILMRGMITIDIPLIVAALAGYAMILVGAVLSYGVSCLMYKLPLSQAAFGAMLRRAAR